MEYKKIKLNGISYDFIALNDIAEEKLSNTSTEEWERSLFHFLLKWFNDDKYVSVQTSGSTGTPKIIRLSKEKMIASAQTTIDFLNINHTHHALLCLSCHHIAGKMMVIRAIVSGCNLIAVAPHENPLKNIFQKIDFAAFVPLQIQSVLSDSDAKNVLTTIPNVIIGGANIPHDILKQLHAFQNNIYETFGMTETISHVALRPISKNNPNDFFETIGSTTVSIDARNCLIVHAPHMSETPLITNDIVELLNEKRFRWKGRFDNVINSGGIKLFPEQIEQKISAQISAHFFVTSIKDRTLGQKAVLIIEAENEANEKETLQKIKPCLSKYELPKQVLTLSSFIKTASGKIDRNKTLRLVGEKYEVEIT